MYVIQPSNSVPSEAATPLSDLSASAGSVAAEFGTREGPWTKCGFSPAKIYDIGKTTRKNRDLTLTMNKM